MAKNVTIPDNDLRSLFDKKFRLGGGNQYISNCPYCNKERHFYINRHTQLWDCKKCGEEGNIIKLLTFLGKLFLLGEFKSIDRTKLKSLSEFAFDVNDDEVDLEPEKRRLPIGFKRVTDDEYLYSRRFLPENLKKLKFGYTNLVPNLKDYIILAVEEDDEVKGYLSRLTWSKEKVERYEERTGRKKLRYLNDSGAKFSNLLLGYDEITEKTDTVILLEGFTDKVTLDNTLQLYEQEEVKCCCTFGKKISQSQILKLLRKGVKNIILIFDYDAIREMKKYGKILNDFFNVKISFTYNKDINDSSEKEIIEIFDRLYDVHYFDRKFVKKL